MVCILCDSKTKITNSRFVRKSGYTWRRHTCPRCAAVYTTREYVNTELSYRIKHSDGSLEPLVRDNLFVMILDSLSHRKSRVADSGALTDTILARVYASKHLIIEDSAFHELVGTILRRFDRTAYIKYMANLGSISS